MEEKSFGRIITDVVIARRLIKKGNVVVDIMPRHGNPVATVFMFKDTEKLRIDEKEICDDIRNKR